MEEIDEDTAPPMKAEEFRPQYPNRADEEGILTRCGLKKKLVRAGHGWDSPEPGDEVSVHYTSRVLGGEQFSSSRNKGEPLVVVIGDDHVLKGCNDGLVTMRKGEIAVFTVPPKSTHRSHDVFFAIPIDATLQFEIEMISWLKVVDVCGDGGIIKKILSRSEMLVRPEKKDEVTVKYEARLEDDSLVAMSPETGVEFLVNDGHLCHAVEKAVVTMRKGEKALLRVDPRYAFGCYGRPAQDGLSAIPPNAVIIISLELVAFKLIECITEDMKVVKKITKPVESFEKPNSGTIVQIRYIAKLEDGTLFDQKGFDGEDPFEFKIDEEQVIIGLDLAVASMKRGEGALIIIDHQYGFGNTQTQMNLVAIPSFSTLYYEVEMVEFTKVKEPWDMEPEQKIEYAAKRKEEGNLYFKAGKYQRASLRYDTAVKYVEFDAVFNEEQKKMGKFFKVSCNLNNAACKIRLKEFREAVALCSRVLQLESCNIKALFRRAQAYIEMTDFDLAALDLKKTHEIDPHNQ
ncbi:Peptidyl-prolyl cis-trans isomerase FKBP65 [Acorus gramineus]|uniref:peptidylprolyl isomerase n=1 Tax=Acorus gramineus TaxID=55184 RepID=A0AAV9AKS1_ACOGR|nr:Peptidyl-prolyl cis-trans isomerase FKBP65 [Acorus gramineus]